MANAVRMALAELERQEEVGSYTDVLAADAL